MKFTYSEVANSGSRQTVSLIFYKTILFKVYTINVYIKSSFCELLSIYFVFQNKFPETIFTEAFESFSPFFGVSVMLGNRLRTQYFINLQL